MNKFFRYSAYVIFFTFALAGLVIIGTIMHEYSHLQDFRSVNLPKEACGLVLPQSLGDLWNGEAGYVAIDPNQATAEQAEQIVNIQKYTEIKAYGIDIALTILFGLCMLVILSRIMDYEVDRRYNVST